MEIHTCNKVVNSINNIMESDTNLNEFGITFTTKQIDELPIVHVEHKLGIASWCIKPLHRHVYSKIKEYRRNSHSIDAIDFLKYSNVCLLIAPEIASIWNIRRTLFQKFCNTKFEYLLTHLVLTNKPKCLEAFNYRKWLTIQNLGSDGVPVPDMLNFIQTELQLSLQAANMKENNYHAWNHRLWCLNFLESRIEGNDLQKLYIDEYQFIKLWVSSNVSQFSGMHYLLTILDKISLAFKQSHFKLEACKVNSPIELHLLLLEYNKKLIEDYSGHESLFYFRKGILLRLLNLLHKDVTGPSDSNQKSEIILEEQNFIVQIMEASNGYMEKNYREWFKRVFTNDLPVSH